MKNRSKTPKNNKEFDQYFEKNDIAHLLDIKTKRVNVDLPAHVLVKLDFEANNLGLTRQALIKYWLSERLGLVTPKKN